MNWISVHDRLPKHRQQVLVWSWDKWNMAVFNEYSGLFELDKNYCVPDVRYWAEVKMPGEE